MRRKEGKISMVKILICPDYVNNGSGSFTFYSQRQPLLRNCVYCREYTDSEFAYVRKGGFVQKWNLDGEKSLRPPFRFLSIWLLLFLVRLLLWSSCSNIAADRNGDITRYHTHTNIVNKILFGTQRILNAMVPPLLKSCTTRRTSGKQ